MRNQKRTNSTRVEELADQFDSTVDRFVNSISKLTTEVALHMQRQDQFETAIAKLDTQHSVLMDKRDTDYRELNQKIDTVEDSIKTHFDVTIEKMQLAHNTRTEKLESRLGSLEKFRWIIAGVIVTITAIFACVKLVIPLLAPHFK